MAKLVAYALTAINLVTFLTYGLDKRLAREHRRRIPERTLLCLAFFGGSFGALTGMNIFRHKTKHRRFMVCVPLFLALHVIIGICLLAHSTGC